MHHVRCRSRFHIFRGSCRIRQYQAGSEQGQAGSGRIRTGSGRVRQDQSGVTGATAGQGIKVKLLTGSVVRCALYSEEVPGSPILNLECMFIILVFALRGARCSEIRCLLSADMNE
jgi:hypothetical protein